MLSAGILGVGSYLFVDGQLHGRAVDDAAAQARFDLAVLVPNRLPANSTQAELQGLVDAFRTRGVETIVDLGTGDPFVSRSDLAGTLGRLPRSMVDLVGAGRLAYAWTTLAGQPALVVGGSPAPGGPRVYFIHDVSALEQALEQLRLALFGGVIVLAIVAVTVARVIARGVLAPVEAAGRAAERIERGDLSARVAVTSNDEFGTWAERFNRMAGALDETIGRLRSAQEQNRRFVADVSHELRTPLAALVAEASILREQLEQMPADARRATELVVHDVGRLRVLVEDLMELSRFDAAAEEVRLEPLDLARLVREVAAARASEARLRLPAESVAILSDSRRLDRILGNLLDNARQHAPGSPVEVELRLDGDDALLTVADRGPGVASDRLAHIFDRFYVADPSRRGGSGLGLAIAAEHAALLGGELGATNREGGGLQVELRLPVTEPLPDGDAAATGEGEAEAR